MALKFISYSGILSKFFKLLKKSVPIVQVVLQMRISSLSIVATDWIWNFINI